MEVINMLSTAHKVKGQGVGSATQEQIQLVSDGLSDKYRVNVNQKTEVGINHYHTIDVKHYINSLKYKNRNPLVGAVHFLPETIEGSIRLPGFAKKVFYSYIISFYKRMDYLVTVNPYFKERLVCHGVDKDKVHYIPNYVSKEEFCPLSQKLIREKRKEYTIKEDDFVVLGVGQVQTRKGVLDFIEIAKENPEIQFVWAGGFSFGVITDGYEELKKIVEEPPKNVHFIGIVNREDMNSIYNMSDVLFMPSYNELFPMAILEAMNCEKPMLLRDIDIYIEILQGYYLKGKNNKEFSSILRNLADNKEYYDKAKNMSKEGALFYSKENVLKIWEKFYANVEEEHRKPQKQMSLGKKCNQ